MSDYEDGYYLFDHDVNHIKSMAEGDGVIFGLSTSGYAGVLALSVSAGASVQAGSVYQTASYASLSIASDGTYPKKAVVYMSGSTITVSQGTASSAIPAGETDKYTRVPTPPNPPAGTVILAEVWIPGGASAGSECTIFNYSKPLHGGYYTFDTGEQ